MTQTHPLPRTLSWISMAGALAACLSSVAACDGSGSSGSAAPFDAGRDGTAAPMGAGGATDAGSGQGNGGTPQGAGGALPGSGGAHQGDGRAPDATPSEAGLAPGDAGSDSGSVLPPLGPYPGGPYGNTVGATFGNLDLKGYEDLSGAGLANLEPWKDPYSLEDLRATRVPYALVHVSAFFCPGCRHAAADLGAQGKGVLDAGGQVLEILSLGNGGAAATRADLDAWIAAYNLDVTSMIGDPTVPLLTAGHREDVYIFEMPSMKIVYAVHGDTSGATPSSIGPAVTRIHQLLGK